MNDLLAGAYDLHVHSAPDLLPRRFDDLEAAARLRDSGMRGFVIKSHFFCTAERAALTRTLYPEVNAVGAIVLNWSVGGLNPAAVEMAARAGAKVVWLPTTDSELERAALPATARDKLPYWAKIVEQLQHEGVHVPPIATVVDGLPTDALIEVLDIIARHGLVLASGHQSPAHTRTIFETAKTRGVDRMIVTHADFPSTFHSVEEQRYLVSLGAFMEHCYTTPATGKVEWSTAIEQIRQVGSSGVIVSTDLGQPGAKFPDEGLAEYADRLLDAGLSENDIRKMIAGNPAQLVES